MIDGTCYDSTTVEITRCVECNSKCVVEETRGEKYSEKELIAYETIGGSPHLDGLYTVFGEVMRGLDIVEKVCNAPVNGASRPLKDIYILNFKVIR